MSEWARRRGAVGFLGACAVLAGLLAGPAFAGRKPITRDDLAQIVTEDLGGVSIECPDALYELDGWGEAVCVKIEHKWKAFRRAFYKALRPDEKKLLPVEPMTTGWEIQGPYYKGRFLAHDGPMRLLFQRHDRWLALLPGHPCLPRSLLDALDVQTASDREGSTLPKRTHVTRPDYPVEARIQKAEGQVILDGVVLANGSVAHACVVYSSRHGVGFEDAALEAVTQWRYQPGVMDGVPVNVIFTIAVGFGFGGG